MLYTYSGIGVRLQTEKEKRFFILAGEFNDPGFTFWLIHELGKVIVNSRH